MSIKLGTSFLLFVTTLLSLFDYSLNLKNCSNTDLSKEPCHESQICDTKDNGITYFCYCLPGHSPMRENDTRCLTKVECILNHDCLNLSADISKKTAQDVIVPTALILVIVICFVYFVVKYRLICLIKEKIVRRTTYNQVMIGREFDDDDPPLL